MNPRTLALVLALVAMGTGACAASPEGDTQASESDSGELRSTTRIGNVTVYQVSRDAMNVVDRAMAFDLEARGFNYMGPEDFYLSARKPGYPFVLFTTKDAQALPKPGTPLFEHEYTHMAAADTLQKLYRRPLASEMRPDGCTFSYRARFHEVCADWKRFVAPVYASRAIMPKVIGVIEADAPAYARRDDYVGKVDITGIDLLDAACLWDLRAIARLENLYDQRTTPGAFQRLFPPHGSGGSCVDDQMRRSEAELEHFLRPGPGCSESRDGGKLAVQREPSESADPAGELEPGESFRRTGETHEDEEGDVWYRIVATTEHRFYCSAYSKTRYACWIAAKFSRPCAE